MHLLQMKILVLFAVCIAEESSEPKFCLSPTDEEPKEEKPEANEMDVGVVILCDSAFVVNTNKEGHPTHEEYIQTLINAAQLRFMDVRELRVVLHLVAVKTVQLSKKRHDYVQTGNGRMQLIAKNLLGYAKKHFLENKSDYEEGDVVLFISGEKLFRTSNEPEMWTGGPTIGGACGDERVAVVYDDGKSFVGTGDVAQAIAFLLGATRDTLHSASHSRAGLGFLTSTIGGGANYGFSPDSKKALIHHYQAHKNNSCWEEPPREQLIQNDTVVLPADFFTRYSLSITYPCYVAYQMRPCSETESSMAGKMGCYTFCCADNSEIVERRPRAPVYDGTPCKDSGICILGKCVVPPTETAVVPPSNDTVVEQ